MPQVHQVSLFIRFLHAMVQRFVRLHGLSQTSLRNPPSFNSSSDLRIFKLDGVPLGRDIPNNLRSSSLSSSKFDNCCSVCSKHRNMPSLPSYGTGSYPIVPFSDFIRYGIVFGHCSHIVQTSSWLGTFLNKSILIMSLLVTILTQFKPHYWLVPVLNIIVILTLSGQCSHAVQTSLLISSFSQ